MTITQLSGYLTALIFAMLLTKHMCAIINDQRQRRFLFHDGGTSCNPNNCIHGRCRPIGDCFCDIDWKGERCDQPFGAQSGTHQHDRCGHHLCIHGRCSYSVVNGIEQYHICKCDHGWTGDACDLHISSVSAHIDPCNNDCVHGSCVGHRDYRGYIDYYHCQCDHGWYGGHCTHQYGGQPDSRSSTSSSARTTTTTTKTSITTTTSTPKPSTVMSTLPSPSATSSKTLATSVQTPTAFPNCDHSAVLTAIAQQTQTVKQNAAECSPGSHTSHDALVLTYCSVPQNTSSWQHGLNVMSYCGGTASLPIYTPIAAFDNGIYSSKGSLSGIFLSCTKTGFKIVVQSCGQPPHITEIALGGTNTQNPNTYYTIF